MSELLEFMQTKLTFGNPRGEPKTGLCPHQVEWVKHYEQNQEVFWGLSRQIGTTHVLAGICVWEMLNKPGFQIVTDNHNIRRAAENIAKSIDANLSHTKNNRLTFQSNGSFLQRLIPPCKGYLADLLVLTPDSFGNDQDFELFYSAMRPLAKPSTGKVIVATLPNTESIKDFFAEWKAANKPYLLTDYKKAGAIERLGYDWFEETERLLGPVYFVKEFGCDFTKTKS